MGQNKFWCLNKQTNKQILSFKRLTCSKRKTLFIKKSLKLNERILSNGKKTAADQGFRMSF